MNDTKTLALVGAEMSRQIAKWGEQNHPSFTPYGIELSTIPFHKVNANLARAICDAKAGSLNLSWSDILMEEVFEAFDEAQAGNLEELRKELIQVAAVACSWIESIDRNQK